MIQWRAPVGRGSNPIERRKTPMMRRLLLTALALMPLMLSGWATASTKSKGIDDSMLGQLSSSLGMTSQQGQGALGSMLMLAQRRLDTGQFQQIAEYIPRYADYIQGARDMGAFSESVSTPAQLDTAFSKIGMTPDQVGKFVPAVTGYLEKFGGRGVADLMTGALR
jgi:hypothetical protein